MGMDAASLSLLTSVEISEKLGEPAAFPSVTENGGLLPPMVSYAQNFEDVMLRRALQDIERGFYVDIGAADPDTDSVTRWFYDNGWRGINVDPDPRFSQKLEERRPGDMNLQCAIGAASENIVFNITVDGGLSTGSEARLAEIINVDHLSTKPLIVPCITLDKLLSLACGSIIDFLKIDAEGMEDDILNFASFTEIRPRIIVVEATKANRQDPAHQSWEPTLLRKGYIFASFDGLNRFYVREEDKKRLSYFEIPPCYFDNFYATTIASRINDAASPATDELRLALETAQSEAHERQRAAEAEIAEAHERQRTAEAAAEEALKLQAQADALAVEALDRQKAAEAEAADQAGVLNVNLIRAKSEAATALRREQTAEAEAAEARRRQHVAEMDAAGAQRSQRAAQAAAADAQQRRQAAEAIAADAKRRQQTAEAIAADAQQRQRKAEVIAADAQQWRQKAEAKVAECEELGLVAEAGGIRRLPLVDKGSSPGPFDQATARYCNRLLSNARHAAGQRDWPNAEAAYYAYLTLSGERAYQIWVLYGHALKEQGYLASAQRAYSVAFDLAPLDADLHLQMGHVLKLRGFRLAMTEAYIKAFRLQPSNSEPRRELAALGYTTWNLIETVTAPDGDGKRDGSLGAPAKVSGHKDRLRVLLARTAARRGIWMVAEKHYRWLTKRYPQDGALWRQLGNVLVQQSRFNEAEGCYLEVLRNSPTDHEVFLDFSDAFDRQGNHEDAAKARARALNPRPADRGPVERTVGL
jgi:FkbM family methyltransferase